MSPLPPLEHDPTPAMGIVDKLIENGIAVLVTAALTWLVSRLSVRKQLEAHNADLTQKFAALEESMSDRMDKLERGADSMRQEVYGAENHGGGMRDRLDALREEQSRQSEAIARIGAGMEVLLGQRGVS